MHSSSLVKVSCIICGNNSTVPIVDCYESGIKYTVSICQNDGLVFLNPRWSNITYDRYYAMEYDNAMRSNIYDQLSGTYKDSAATKIIERIHSAACLAGKPTLSVKSVLDIGAGMGWTLNYLRKLHIGTSFYAIEMSQYCVNNLIDSNIKVLTNNANLNWHLQYNNFFDLVILRHTLEHFFDPINILCRVRSVISNNGIVYIAVPNMICPKLPLLGYWFRPAHTYYFSPEILIHCAALAGLAPIAFEIGHNSEIWGVFTKSKTIKFSVFNSVFIKQMNVINESFAASLDCSRRP